jgi:hypothetical protein
MPLTRRKTSRAAYGLSQHQLETDSLGGKLAAQSPPRDFLELRDRLNRCRSEGAACVAAVANYAIEQPLDVAFGTIHSVASGCSVSTTSVLRLAVTLGFEGFRDMREFFRRPLRASGAPNGIWSCSAPLVQSRANAISALVVNGPAAIR